MEFFLGGISGSIAGVYSNMFDVSWICEIGKSLIQFIYVVNKVMKTRQQLQGNMKIHQLEASSGLIKKSF